MNTAVRPGGKYGLAVAGLGAATDHPARLDLADELHARPFLRIDAPARVTHLAVLGETGGSAGAAFHLALAGEFFAALALPPPPPGSRHLTHVEDGLQVKWECHTEFSSLTVVGPADAGEPFAAWHDPLASPPAALAGQLADKRLVALQVEVLNGDQARRVGGQRARWFGGNALVGSRVLGGGEVWGDWRVAGDGFSRFLVLDLDFRENQVGRLVQRLAEIETYRMMALLSLPIARDMLGRIETLEASLAEVMCRMAADSSAAGEASLLLALTELAGQVEALSAGGNRFGASQAYDQLVLARIHELREERIEGVPTIGEFMERRLSPAMDTCRSVRQRQTDLAERIARAIDLLRTRVNLMQERQVTELLGGMNRTASTQLKLQHAVEGLSVVAIAYYAVSLLSHVLAALHEVGWQFNAKVVEALSIPVVLAVAYLLVRGVHRRLAKE